MQFAFKFLPLLLVSFILMITVLGDEMEVSYPDGNTTTPSTPIIEQGLDKAHEYLCKIPGLKQFFCKTPINETESTTPSTAETSTAILSNDN